MKKLITTLSFVFVTVLAIAQVPDIMNYQAVARNNSGQALANQTIKVRLTINKNAVSQYSETRQVTTNALGLFNVQIGSTGAISTTGSFSGINWQNNAAPGYVLKVELDINNTNVFTDMGSQTLVTVPFAFASKKADQATETVNIAGRPVDQSATPPVGARLSWNGSSWTPVKKDEIIPVGGAINSVPAGGAAAPWNFASVSELKTVTVTGNETIVATINGSIGHLSSGTTVNIGASICYQNVNGGAITPFDPANYTSTFVTSTGANLASNAALVSVSGAVVLPAGTYKIGLAIKNFHPSQTLNNTTSQTGFVEVRY